MAWIPTHQFANKLRANMTACEKILDEPLRNRGFISQFPINHFIADFACPRRMLVVEVDGDTHLSPSDVLKDRRRDLYFKSKGWEVIRFTNDAVRQNPKECIAIVSSWMRERPRIKSRDRPCLVTQPTPYELENSRTPRGGYSRKQLAEWGIPWPPPKGWRSRLKAQAKRNVQAQLTQQ